MYADDSNLKVSADSQDEIDAIDFIELSNFQQVLYSNNLFLNTVKTNFKFFYQAK